ncbi:MAG: SDR family oxidoreductase [Caulobacterales bacterium]
MTMLKNKTALITGGGSGIGRATALIFAREGARVAAVDRDENGAKETARMIAAAGGEAIGVAADVAKASDVSKMAQAIVKAFGGIDVAVNAAGIVGGGSALADSPDDTWDLSIAINLSGLRLCMKEEIAAMRRAGGGAIVNISSGAGLHGLRGSAGYSASKHGVIGLTKTAAIDHALENIRINAICPGLVLTPMTQAAFDAGYLDAAALAPMARPGKPEEIGEAALWLCSEKASFVTGAALPVDGGHMA